MIRSFRLIQYVKVFRVGAILILYKSQTRGAHGLDPYGGDYSPVHNLSQKINRALVLRMRIAGHCPVGQQRPLSRRQRHFEAVDQQHVLEGSTE